jgi:hypothetical protein
LRVQNRRLSSLIMLIWFGLLGQGCARTSGSKSRQVTDQKRGAAPAITPDRVSSDGRGLQARCSKIELRVAAGGKGHRAVFDSCPELTNGAESNADCRYLCIGGGVFAQSSFRTSTRYRAKLLRISEAIDRPCSAALSSNQAAASVGRVNWIVAIRLPSSLPR